MTCLSLSLMGPFRVTLDGGPVTAFESDKVRALLAYLAVESARSHRRETLAGLLWPERPEREARRSLSQTLFNLRRAISDREAEPSFLLVTPQTVQFNRASDHWLDVTTFTGLLVACKEHDHGRLEACDPCLERLQEAVALHRGNFLEGLSMGDSAAFEEWCVLNRERLHRLVVETFQCLADCHEWRGEVEAALRHAWRQVELDSWREKAHRQLMRLLALNGQRGAALAQYETCRHILAEELGVEPGAKTTRLYEQIRDGELRAGVWESSGRGEDLPVALPSFLSGEETVETERPVFVARERELAQLQGFLDQALAGWGRVVFVTGDAGQGKTVLIQEFARRAQAAHPDLVVASGNGNAHTGIGDPYLPFREVLGLLTGDVKARWAAGAMPREQAHRLWRTLPLTAQTLVEAGPDLIDLFVPGAALVKRAVASTLDGASWLPRLEELVERKASLPLDPTLQQSALFEQYTQVMRALAHQRPLLLVLDDLQWADGGSTNLLFHLGKRIEGSRVLIVGAYRPEEVALGRGDPSAGSGRRKRHPLEPVVNEFKRHFGDIEVSLRQDEERHSVDARHFVDALVDTEPNRLGDAFREALYQQTRGHPLFTVELLHGMQERGDLVKNGQDRWVEGPSLDWETLPARVEAVIAERIARLPECLQDALTVASVEGETFTAEVVARVRAIDEQEMVGRLSGELDRRHRLVSAQGVLRTDGQRLSLYRFRHILFQRYLYNSLDQVERVHLHETVGTILEALYGEGVGEIAAVAPQLARHFQEAGIAEKAVVYLHRAGERALRMSAHQEAIAHFSQALDLLETLPDTPERTQQELALQIGLGASLQATKGYGAPEVSHVYGRARELCQQMGERAVQMSAHQEAIAHFSQALDLLETLPDTPERTQQELALQISLVVSLQITKGYADSEVGRVFARARELCGQVEETLQTFLVLALLVSFYEMRGEPQTALEIGEQLLSMAERTGVPLLLAVARFLVGCIMVHLGEFDQARAHLEQAIAFYDPQLYHSLLPSYGPDIGVASLSFVSIVLWILGHPEQGLKQSQEAIALAEELSHPHSLIQAQALVGIFHTIRRDAQSVQKHAEACIPLYTEHGFDPFSATERIFRGWALAEQGRVEEGIAEIRQGIADSEAMGAELGRPHHLSLLAEAHGKAGQIEEGLAAVAEALAAVSRTEERVYEAEIHRLKGELLRMQGAGAAEVEACFRQAIEVARQQQAKSWELRAVMSLCRLWQEQGKREEARQMLAELYSWFSEGFDTPDLKEAKALLEELS